MSIGIQSATKSVTGTNLSVALALLLASGGLAYMAGGANLAGTGSGGQYGYGYNACGVAEFSVSDACEKTYRGTTMVCYDGKKFTANSCTTQREAAKLCNGHCKGNKCGANTMTRGTACEQQYRAASGMCADGTAATSYRGECRTASSLRTRMESECANRYCGPVPNGQLTLQIADDSPLQRLIAVGPSGTSIEVPILKFKAHASVEDVDISQLTFLYYPVAGSDEQSSFKRFMLYQITQNSEFIIGNAMLVPAQNTGSPATITFTLPTTLIQRDQDRLFMLKAEFSGTDEGTSSAMSPFVQLGNGSLPDTEVVHAIGVTTGIALGASAINGADTVNIRGSHVVLYRSFPLFTYVNPGMELVNGVQNNLYSFKVRSMPSGPVALKQLKFTMQVVDNVGTPNPDIRISNFKLFRNDIDLTRDESRVRIQLADGRVLSPSLYAASTTVGIGQNTIFYVTWVGSNEEEIPSNSERTFTIKADVSGFTTDSDDDYIRVRLLNDQYMDGELSQVIDPYYLVSGNGPLGNLMVLGDRSQANLVPADIIWSDKTALSHSASPNRLGTGSASSTPDWFNGYLMNDAPLNYSSIVR